MIIKFQLSYKECMNIEDIVIMIPCYKPDEKFIRHLKNLSDAGYKKIIVIDDGSGLEYKHFFDQAREEYNCDVVVHHVNLGQGRAYKSGFNYFLGKYEDNAIGIIQCDCDGQHDIEDINKCAQLLKEKKEFILGVRNFDDKSIPFRSRFGNKCTEWVFKIFCGLDIKDTQTGLKGIPTKYVPILMEVQGERFEYASSILLETKKQGWNIYQFPIKTIYINGNETSHFNPLLDSIRIYSLIMKYLMSSLSAFIIDIVAFSFFIIVYQKLGQHYQIIMATYSAKIISCTYSYVINKNLVFNNNNKITSTLIKFILLCAVQSTCSGVFTASIVAISTWNAVLCKIIVDTLLFFISFQIQDRWVFKNVSKNK